MPHYQYFLNLRFFGGVIELKRGTKIVVRVGKKVYIC